MPFRYQNPYFIMRGQNAPPPEPSTDIGGGFMIGAGTVPYFVAPRGQPAPAAVPLVSPSAQSLGRQEDWWGRHPEWRQTPVIPISALTPSERLVTRKTETAQTRVVRIGGANGVDVPYDVLEDAARPLADVGVTADQIARYMDPRANRGRWLSPQTAAARAGADNDWAREASRVGVLTGDAWRDDLIWREHWAFEQGLSGRDPLLTGHPESVQRLEGLAEQRTAEQGRMMVQDIAANWEYEGGSR